MLSTYEDEDEEQEILDFVDSNLGIFVHPCGCVDCCICDDSHINYGDEEDDWDDWGD